MVARASGVGVGVGVGVGCCVVQGRMGQRGVAAQRSRLAS